MAARLVTQCPGRAGKAQPGPTLVRRSFLLAQHCRLEVTFLPEKISTFARTDEDNREICEAIDMLLANDQRDAVAWHLIYWKTRIAPTGQEKRQGRETLLQILETLEIPASKDPHWEAAGLAKDIIRLNPTPEDQRRTRHALLKLPSRNTRLEALAT